MSANEMNPRKSTSSFSKREKMQRNPFSRGQHRLQRGPIVHQPAMHQHQTAFGRDAVPETERGCETRLRRQLIQQRIEAHSLAVILQASVSQQQKLHHHQAMVWQGRVAAPFDGKQLEGELVQTGDI